MEKDHVSCPLKNKLKRYFICLRPWSFTASLVSVLLGTVLAWKFEDNFDIRRFGLTVVAVLSTHAAGNLVNTLYDYNNGVDTDSSDDQTLVKKILNTQEISYLIQVCYEIAIASFLVICLGFPMVNVMSSLPLFLAGLLLSFIYTGSIGLKYLALGDLVVFVAFGPVITLFTSAVQTGNISLANALLAFPLAFHTEAILHGNNIRDLETDKSAGIVTMAMLLGRRNACVLYTALLLTPYIIVIFIAVTYSLYLLLPLLSIPMAFKLNSEFYRGNLAELPQKTAFVNLVFGVLYVCGFVLVR